MAKLPFALVDRNTLVNMKIGRSRYTTPWAMWVDADMECWLHPHYTAQREPGGTVCMRVERREDGYHVFPPPGETYQPQDHHGFMSPDDTPWIPVAKVYV